MNFVTRKATLPLLLILFVSISLPQQTTAQSKGMAISDDDMEVTFTDRMQRSNALRSITTREGSVDLMLTETDLLIQFSDKGLTRITNEINKESADSHFAEVIKSMVSSGVRTLLDRAMSIPLYEISEISYNDGKLLILNSDGQEIFEDMTINNSSVMDGFTRRDARRFAADARKLLR